MSTINYSNDNNKAIYKKITYFFIILPDTILHFSNYLNENSSKGNRIRILADIFNNGITEFTKNLNENEIFKQLLEFEKAKELDEWIISGLTKKDQDELFNSDSENELNDSP